jgi:hypothetical protein
MVREASTAQPRETTMLAPALLSLLALAAPPTGALAELAASLGKLVAHDAVKARLEQRLSVRQGDEPARPEGTVSASVSAGPDGLELRWARPFLEQAAAEELHAATDPETPTPTRDAMASLDALDTSHLLDAAPLLLRALDGATLLEDRPDALDGQPARLLVLKLEPQLSARNKKYVKELIATARVWLGPDGLPLAAEREVRVKGRVMLVLSFESEEKTAYRFLHAGDRLVTVSLRRDVRSDGVGEKSERHEVTALALAP